ncbi:MAG: hypothetical protein Q7U98_12595 [Methylicorpusculum sp.]|uniref:hypothetical protein n=1 Tax=Methylicorpusculum sp. TaxID=2713644 RepID=UPI0027248B8C|nr:hypothetical protein [Methylicorpusculum sp.]MDO8939988.1 hypothetical protein [Methylicorpusculum sp.]MDP2203116.1 hypothetical protein [Methylicorpusculum sp.]
MNSLKISKIATLLSFSFGLAFSSFSQANSLVIDNFSDYQYVYDLGGDNIATTEGPLAIAGTGLTGATRTLIAQATGSNFHETAIETDNSLSISNTSQSAGNASVIWNFNLTDFTLHGNAIMLQVLAIDIQSGVFVQMIANGSSSSNQIAINGAGDLYVNFSDFDNASVFQGLNQFQLNFKGPQSWDAEFKVLTATTPVPLPPAFALMSLALFGIGSFRKYQHS